MSVFTTQGYLTLVLDTGIGIANATSLKILYIKPSGKKGSFTAFPDSSNTKLRYQLTNKDIDEAGRWQLQAFAVINNLNAYGEITYHEFKKHI